MSSSAHHISAAHAMMRPARPAQRWAWPVAICVGIPIGGYVANLIVGKVDTVGASSRRRADRGRVIGAAQWLR